MREHFRSVLMARRLSLPRLLRLAVSFLLLSHAMSAFAVLPREMAYVANQTDDTVVNFAITELGLLTEVGRTSAGKTPVALAAHPSNLYVYGVNNASPNTLSMYLIEPTTQLLTEVTRVGTGIDPRWVGIHPGGIAVYTVSHGFAPELPNVAYNAIWRYAVNPFNGEPTFAEAIDTGGAYGVEGAIHPSGAFLVLANRYSNDLSLFRIDPTTGALTWLEMVPAPEGPVSVVFDPRGERLFVAHYDSRQLSMFQLNSTTGVLTEQWKVSTTGFPSAVRVDPSGEFLFVANDILEGLDSYRIAGTELPVRISTVPAGGKGSHAIALAHTGLYLYLTNHYDSDGYHGGNVAPFTIDAASGTLTPIGAGPVPTAGFPTAVMTSNPIADQARQDLLARAAADLRFGTPLHTPAVDTTAGRPRGRRPTGARPG